MSHWLTLKGVANAQEEADLWVVCRCGAECFLPVEVQEPEKYLAGLLEWHRAEMLLEELREETRLYAAKLVIWADSGAPAESLGMVDDRPWISAMRDVGLITDESLVQP